MTHSHRVSALFTPITGVAVPLLLASVLSVGSIVGSAQRAYAAVPELRTSRSAGVDISGPLAADGTTVVMGTHRSVDSGKTWVSDASLEEVGNSRWVSSAHGMLTGARSGTTSTYVSIYRVSTGVLSRVVLTGLGWNLNQTWAISRISDPNPQVYNFDTQVSLPYVVPAEKFPGGFFDRVLGPSGAIVWRDSDGSSDYYSVSSSPTGTPGPWTLLPTVATGNSSGPAFAVTDTRFVYVAAVGADTMYCSRLLSDFTAAPTCVPAIVGQASVHAMIVDYGQYQIVRIDDLVLGRTKWFVGDGSTLSAVLLPTGESLEYVVPDFTIRPIASGDVMYLVHRDIDGLPSIVSVAPNGTLAAGMDLPTSPAAYERGLAVAPDRAAGQDNRERARTAYSTWTRPVTSSAFGSETLMRRGTRLDMSAGRTAIGGPDGLSIYDRGALTYAVADPRFTSPSMGPPDVDVSGPYASLTVARLGAGPYDHGSLHGGRHEPCDL